MGVLGISLHVITTPPPPQEYVYILGCGLWMVGVGVFGFSEVTAPDEKISNILL